MREYDLKKLVSTGSYTRNSIKPQLLVAEDGEYRQGDILDANATMEVVSSTASDIDDKINDILGVDNGAVQELVGILSDSDTTTGILNELAKKANISDLEIVAGDIPQVPTNVSAFTNDAGYLTQHQDISGKANSSDLSTVATSGSYNDLSNKPHIPEDPVQSDWAEDDTTDQAYIKNKPNIPNAQIQSDWAQDDNTQVDYIKNKPDLSNFVTKSTAESIQYDTNSHAYVDLGLPSGILWATMNVGASNSTDVGLYFQWGDTNGYTSDQVGSEQGQKLFDSHWSDYALAEKYITTDKQILDAEDDAVSSIWGGAWRMPTKEEFEELFDSSNTTKSFVTIDNVAGIKFTSNRPGYTDKYVFFPVTGFPIDGHFQVGNSEEGFYWSSSLKTQDNDTLRASEMWFATQNSTSGVEYAPRNFAAAIRGVFEGQAKISKVATSGDYNDLVNKPEIIRVVEITGNLSNQTTSITGIQNDGKKETVIYINNTENTYYITVSNSYKTLRNTQLSLVACPGGYCEVSYTNKGGIIFAKGLVMGVRQSDSNSKYILATYGVTNTDTATPLIYPEALSAYADMEIDGALQSSPVASYNFDTVGEHTVKFILPDLEQFDEQNGIKFGWMDTGNKLKSIVLPEGITTIPAYSFIACQSLESVTLPSTIRTIGNAAFGAYWKNSNGSSTLIGCDRLSSINIPNGVTSIGYGCFTGCASLTSITIPNSVTSLGNSAFDMCTGLTTVSLGTGITTLRQEMFRRCTSLTDVTIPNTITSIQEGVFCGCSSLQTIVIPDSVTELGDIYAYLHDYEGVFSGCTSLANVTLSNNLRTLRGHTFYNCTSLQTLNIPDKLQSIDATALIGCSNLTAFNVSNNNTELSSVDGAIYNKDVTKLVRYPIAKQGTFTIPSTVTSLGGYNLNPFVYCNGITTIEIGQDVSSIYPSNFSLCSSLTAINVDANNQNYSSINGVLYNKNASKLIRCPEGKQSVTIPNTVTELEDYSFIQCANITTIDIPNSVTTIGDSTFDYCTNLSTITIPSSVTSMGDNFNDCNSLPVINDIRYADTYAIRCTSSGKSTYTIKSGTRFIGNGAFEGQENLQNITIPSTVIAMSDYVFDRCSKLDTITFEGMTAPDVHSDTFRGVKSSGGTIRVPANSTGYDVIMQKNGLSNWTKVEY